MAHVEASYWDNYLQNQLNLHRLVRSLFAILIIKNHLQIMQLAGTGWFGVGEIVYFVPVHLYGSYAGEICIDLRWPSLGLSEHPLGHDT